MPTFRVYFLDRGAHISRPPEIIECANDQEATEKARQFIDGLDIELWHQDRMVANFPKNRPVERGRLIGCKGGYWLNTGAAVEPGPSER